MLISLEIDYQTNKVALATRRHTERILGTVRNGDLPKFFEVRDGALTLSADSSRKHPALDIDFFPTLLEESRL